MLRYIFLILTCCTMLFSCNSEKSADEIYHYGSPDRKKLPKLTLLNHDKIMKELIGKPNIEIKTIGILVYDGCNGLEAITPMAVFSELMSVKMEYIGLKEGIVKTDIAEIYVSKTLKDAEQLDLLVVPGGNQEAMKSVLSNTEILSWIKETDAHSKLTAGMGYGTAILGKAGLLQGKNVAFNWYQADENVQKFGAKKSTQRYTHDGKYWTAVNGTAALDACLAMIEAIAGRPNLEGAMLDLEYDPQPPLVAGTFETTSDSVKEILSKQSYTLDGLQLLDNHPVNDSNAKKIKIGILVYEGFFTLDAIGPLAVLSQLDNAEVQLISAEKEKIKSGRSYFHVTQTIGHIEQLDILVIPGGADKTWELSQNEKILDWVKKTDAQTQITASVCTGSAVLGSAGFLKGRKATTNWYRAQQMLERYGAEYVHERYVADGKYWTSAGVSAGIDMSFALIDQLKGRSYLEYAMLRLEYHPQPPIDAGSPEKTDDLVLDMMHQMYDYIMLPLLRKE